MRTAAAAPPAVAAPAAAAQPRRNDHPKSPCCPSTAGRAVSQAVTPIPKRSRMRRQKRTPTLESPIAVNS